MSRWVGCRVVCGDRGMMEYETLSRSARLTDQRGLFQGDQDGAHARHIFGLLAGLWVEVAEPSHPLPLCAGVVVV